MVELSTRQIGFRVALKAEAAAEDRSLAVLAEADGPRSTTELNHHFSNQMNLSHLDHVYEWLADLEVILRVSMPVRITEKSRVEFDEAAYYYQPE